MNKIYLFAYLLFIITTCKAQTVQEEYSKFSLAFEKGSYQKATKLAPALLTKLKMSDSLYMEVCSYNAYAWFSLKNYDSAIVYCSRELESRLKYTPTEQEMLSNTYYLLSIYYSYLAQYAPAILNMIESRNRILEIYGDKHLTSIHMTNQLANLYNLAGSTNSAEQLYEANYELVKNNFKTSDSIYQVMANAISAFYTSNGIYDKAEPFFIDALTILESYYGKKSQNYMMSMNSFGEFYIYAGQYDKAIELYKKFEVLSAEFYGKKSADYATALNNLAVSYEKAGNYAEAEKIYINCLSIKEKVYTKKSNFYATTLINLGVVYDYQGKYKEAEKMLEEAIEIYKEINGENSENYATALSNIASVYSSNGKNKEALAVLNQSLEIYKSIYGDQSVGYINCLNNIARMHYDIGEYDASEKEFNQVIYLREKMQGKNHIDLAVALSSLANLKSLKGDYNSAKQLLERALKITELTYGKMHVSYANILQNLANFYTTTGNFTQANLALEECSIIYAKMLGPMHPEYAIFLNNYGQFHFERGEINEAYDKLNKAMAIQIATFGEDHPQNISLMSNMANVLVAKAEFQEAEKLISKAIEIGKANFGMQHADYGTLLNNAAVLYYEIGNLNVAENYYNEALQSRKLVYGEKHPEYAVSLNNLGTLLLSKATTETDEKKYNSYLNTAIDYFNQALKIDSIQSQDNNPLFAHHLNNLGEAHRLKNEAQKAIDYFHLSLEFENKFFPDNKKAIAVSYHNIALVYAGLNNTNEAKKYALKSLKLFEEQFGKDCQAASSVTSSIAFIYELEKNIPEALSYYQKAIRINTASLEKNFLFLSEAEKSEYLNSIALYSEMFASFVLKNHKEHPELVAHLYNEEIKRKGILLRSSGNLKNQIASKNDKELNNTYQNWINIKEYLGQQYSIAENKRDKNLDSLENKANQLEKLLVTAVGEDAFNKTDNNAWKITLNNLKANQAAIEFISFMRNDDLKETVYCAIIILPGQSNPELVELFTENKLNEITGTNPGKNFNYINSVYGKTADAVTGLSNLILAPFISKLNNCTEVFYSPAGNLNKISFAALKLSSGQYFSDKFSLSLVSNTATLKQNKTATFNPSKGVALLYGGINYGQEKGNWNYLPATLTESGKINSILSAGAIRVVYETGEQASEAKFKSEVKNNSPSILHIATHGFFYDDAQELAKNKIAEQGDVTFRGASTTANVMSLNKNPMLRSGLVLAGANDDHSTDTSIHEDGILTAYEVSLLNLSKTQLVVLSACETGLGDVKGSEGVYGLQRSFKMAGANKLIMSLWQVPDKETEEFMTLFYTQLLKSKDIRIAFNNAQGVMRKKYDPYYWAAFVLIE